MSRAKRAYEAPQIAHYGSLSELTQGGVVGPVNETAYTFSGSGT